MHLLSFRRHWAVMSSVFVALALSGCLQQKDETRSSEGAGSNTVQRASDQGQTSAEVVELSSDAEKLAGIKIGEAQQKLLNFSVKTTGEVTANANLLTHVTTPV